MKRQTLLMRALWLRTKSHTMKIKVMQCRDNRLRPKCLQKKNLMSSHRTQGNQIETSCINFLTWFKKTSKANKIRKVILTFKLQRDSLWVQAKWLGTRVMWVFTLPKCKALNNNIQDQVALECQIVQRLRTFKISKVWIESNGNS